MDYPRRSLPFGIALLVAVLGSLSSGPAAGDWLVTSDGEAVETRGGWEVRGKLILFHTSKGTYSSLRVDDVNLDASRARTEAAVAARNAKRNRSAPEAPAAPKAKFVLTDDDVAHVDPDSIPNPLADPADEGANAEETPAGDFAAAGENPLEVVNWDAVIAADNDGVIVTGVLSNPTDLHAANINVRVTILDLSGAVIGEAAATMAPNALAPGDQGSFQAYFTGVFSVGSARFDVTSFNAVVPSQPEIPEGPALGI